MHPIKSKICNYVSAPVVIYGCWIIFSGIITGTSPARVFFYMTFIVWWIFSLRFFATYTFRNKSSIDKIIKMFILMFFVWICLNVLARNNLQDRHGRYGITMFVYNVLILVPYLFYIKKTTVRNSLLFLACIAVIISLKRGAIVTLPVMLFAYYGCKYKMEGHFGKIIWPTIIAAILIGGVLLFINYNTDGLLFSRFTEDELRSGSGRDTLRAGAIADILNRDVLTFIIGRGSGSAIQYFGTGIHNEWLESFFTYGLIGVSIYLWMFIRCMKFALRMMRHHNPDAPIAAMWASYLLMVTIFSGFMFMHVAFYFWSGLGFLIGKSKVEHSRILT